MKPRLFSLLLSPMMMLTGALLAGGCASDKNRPVVALPSPKYLADALPPGQVEIQTAAPEDSPALRPGFWTRVNTHWVWRPGSWTPANVGASTNIE